jgi:hypothetical protein
MDNPYRNQLNSLLTNPNSFNGSPGFQFALNSGMDGVARKFAAMGMGNSGNVLGEMSRYGTGLAQQDYGNSVDRLGRLAGEQDQTDLGNKTADNAYALGQGNLALGNKQADQGFGLGMYRAGNDFTLGQQQNQNSAQNNFWNYSLGADRNNLAAAENQNNYNLGMYGAQTQRGAQQSNAWSQGQNSLLDWTRFGYQLHPQQRIAGVS